MDTSRTPNDPDRFVKSRFATAWGIDESRVRVEWDNDKGAYTVTILDQADTTFEPPNVDQVYPVHRVCGAIEDAEDSGERALREVDNPAHQVYGASMLIKAFEEGAKEMRKHRKELIRALCAEHGPAATARMLGMPRPTVKAINYG